MHEQSHPSRMILCRYSHRCTSIEYEIVNINRDDSGGVTCDFNFPFSCHFKVNRSALAISARPTITSNWSGNLHFMVRQLEGASRMEELKYLPQLILAQY